MKPLFFKQINGLLQETVFSKPGKFESLCIICSGTAGAGITVALADLGIFRVAIGGEQCMNIDATRLSELDQRMGPAYTAASAIGAAFQFCLVIPFRDYFNKDDKNVLAEGFSVDHDGAVAASFAPAGALNIAYFGMMADGQQMYRPVLLQNSTLASNTSIELQRRDPMVIQISPTANGLAMIDFLADDRVIAHASEADLVAMADAYTQVETAGVVNTVLINLYTGLNQWEARANKLYILQTPTNPADTIIYTVFYADFDHYQARPGVGTVPGSSIKPVARLTPELSPVVGPARADY
jgi:hypothetical protein